MAGIASTTQSIRAILAIDQGTSSTKALVVGEDGSILSRHSVTIGRSDPQPGWVEQNAAEIRDSVIAAAEGAIREGQRSADIEIVAAGLSNQRESAIAWSRVDGQPLGPLLGWQDRRTASRVDEAEREGWAPLVKERTGLPLDPMFSALKLQWLLDRVDPDRSAAAAGEIAVGTVDSWIVYCLTGEHRIEMGNASRTQLLNLDTADWDDDLLERFSIPRACLPRIAASSEPSQPITGITGLPEGTRIHGVLGDSHAALFAHGVRTPGRVKATYGSGSSIMGLLGDSGAAAVDGGLVRTIAWADPAPVYAFEGTILSTGATLLWLSGVLGIQPEQLSALAQTADSCGGVDLVPAFAGLGAPYWDEKAVAIISGFGLGTGSAELARSAFESVALQTEALFASSEHHIGTRIETVLTDGGPTQNDWLMQLQADLSQRQVSRSNVAELSATGAAHLAGVSCGLWSAADCEALPRDRTLFAPAISPDAAAERVAQWDLAVERSRFCGSPDATA